MKITGSANLAAEPQQVWDAFHDPAVLARCLPGCNRLTELGPDRYAMTVTAGVAAIKGTYDGEVALLDPQHPEMFTMKASGAGAPGTVDADVTVRLAPAASGGTELSYDADAAVGGMIGGVGQRMLAGVTRKMAGQLFAAVDADIAGVAAPVAVVGAASPAAPLATVGTGLPSAANGIPAPTSAPGGVGTVYAGRSTTQERSRMRDYALGVVSGGAVAIVGVVVGWAIGRG